MRCNLLHFWMELQPKCCTHFPNSGKNVTVIPNKASPLCILMYFICDVTVQSCSQHQPRAISFLYVSNTKREIQNAGKRAPHPARGLRRVTAHPSRPQSFSHSFFCLCWISRRKNCQLETFPLANFFSHWVWDAGVINPASVCATCRGRFGIVCTVKYPLYCLFLLIRVYFHISGMEDILF